MALRVNGQTPQYKSRTYEPQSWSPLNLGTPGSHPISFKPDVINKSSCSTDLVDLYKRRGQKVNFLSKESSSYAKQWSEMMRKGCLQEYHGDDPNSFANNPETGDDPENSLDHARGRTEKRSFLISQIQPHRKNQQTPFESPSPRPEILVLYETGSNSERPNSIDGAYRSVRHRAGLPAPAMGYGKTVMTFALMSRQYYIDRLTGCVWSKILVLDETALPVERPSSIDGAYAFTPFAVLPLP
ncbi:hypothetical protein NHQ30_010084 [Ciborinia camelliae]|nr:hypothetical protein NHQ30_010084 [Ciborinia camelliae]